MSPSIDLSYIHFKVNRMGSIIPKEMKIQESQDGPVSQGNCSLYTSVVLELKKMSKLKMRKK